MLESTLALLDEIDLVSDVDALKVVSKGVDAMRGEGLCARSSPKRRTKNGEDSYLTLVTVDMIINT